MATATEHGQVWTSASTRQSFLLEPGQVVRGCHRTWNHQVYIGQKARRTSDGKLALVNLTDKPEDYPYDHLLLG